MIVRAPATSARQLLRDGLDAQRAYCAEVGQLTVAHLRRLLATARGASTASAQAAVPTLTPSAAPAIVLEGEDGAFASARFVVENQLDEAISAPICVSPFQSELGREVDVRLHLEPETVTLEPAEQLLVRVGTTIDERLAGDGGCWGVLGIPALPGTELVVLVRHRSTASAPGAPPTSSPPRARGSS